MMRFLLTLLLSVCFAAAAQPWAAPDHPHRLRLELPAQPAGTGTLPLHITGEDLWRWTGEPRLDGGGFRLYQGANRLPLQIEERDGTNEILADANGVLDADDELLLAVPTGTQPTVVYLYYGGPAEAPLPAAVTIAEDQAHDLMLSAAGLTIGVRGGGLGADVHERPNYGRAVIRAWKFGGHQPINIARSWGSYMPYAVAASKDAPPWSAPVIVAAGPVRTVVRFHLPEYSAMKGDTEVWRGSITRTVAMWAAAPVVDIRETIVYESGAYEFDWPYGCTLQAGEALTTEDVLYLPLAGAARVWPLIPDAETYANEPYRTVYDDPNPNEGWLAWIDRSEGHGLGIFYERLPAIEKRARWVTYRPGRHPLAYVRTTPGAGIEVRLTIRDRALRSRPQHTRDMRYMALRDEEAEAVRARYLAWSLRWDRLGIVGQPEERP